MSGTRRDDSSRRGERAELMREIRGQRRRRLQLRNKGMSVRVCGQVALGCTVCTQYRNFSMDSQRNRSKHMNASPRVLEESHQRLEHRLYWVAVCVSVTAAGRQRETLINMFRAFHAAPAAQVATENRQSERVCEIADASASFQSEVWKHFPCVERCENVTYRPKKKKKPKKQYADDITLRHLFVFMAAAKVHSWFDKCHFFKFFFCLFKKYRLKNADLCPRYGCSTRFGQRHILATLQLVVVGQCSVCSVLWHSVVVGYYVH